MTKEPITFEQTFEFLEKNGWERISPEEYVLVKRDRKHDTARVGARGFFKLKVSKLEIRDKRLGVV